MTWQSFTKTLIVSTVALVAGLFLFVLLVDPYDSLWFSPPLDRAPASQNQRYSYPALARDPQFDSLVIGNSTVAMLRPDKLNQALGGRFVNLSINDGIAIEQARMLDLFARRHLRIETAIFGIDMAWCQVEADYRRVGIWPFPHWLYDADPWNDLVNLFDLPAIENAGRQLAITTGLLPPVYHRDGYNPFLPPPEQYDLARVRDKIYGAAGPRVRTPVVPAVEVSEAELASWTFAAHALMGDMLTALPEATRKVLLVVPYHRFFQPLPGSRAAVRYRECKQRLANLAASVPNSMVVDFMISSEITSHDENYWDDRHYTRAVADRIADLIAGALQDRRGIPGLFEIAQPDPALTAAQR